MKHFHLPHLHLGHGGANHHEALKDEDDEELAETAVAITPVFEAAKEDPAPTPEVDRVADHLKEHVHIHTDADDSNQEMVDRLEAELEEEKREEEEEAKHHRHHHATARRHHHETSAASKNSKHGGGRHPHHHHQHHHEEGATSVDLEVAGAFAAPMHPHHHHHPSHNDQSPSPLTEGELTRGGLVDTEGTTADTHHHHAGGGGVTPHHRPQHKPGRGHRSLRAAHGHAATRRHTHEHAVTSVYDDAPQATVEATNKE